MSRSFNLSMLWPVNGNQPLLWITFDSAPILTSYSFKALQLLPCSLHYKVNLIALRQNIGLLWQLEHDRRASNAFAFLIDLLDKADSFPSIQREYQRRKTNAA
jgi:hypothetical protein